MKRNRKLSMKMGENERKIDRKRQIEKGRKRNKKGKKKKHNGIVRCSSKITVKINSIFRMKGNINYKAV
jgi:hypothetical protein